MPRVRPAWPQFRGPNGAGVADDATLPVTWSATEHVAWTVDLPGRGWSSPIVWGDRVFVTSAVNTNAFKAPWQGHLRQRLRRRAREAGAVRGRDRQEAGRPRHRAGERVRRDQLRRRGARRQDRQGRCGSARRIAARRPAAATARTPTRPKRRPPTASGSTRRSAATSASSATRSTARCSGRGPGSRSRSTSTSARRRRRSSTTGASISCTTTTASRSSSRSTPRPARRSGRVKRTDLDSRLASGLGDAADLDEREADRDRHHRPRLRHQLRPRRQGAVARQGLPPVDAEPDRRRRPALRRLGIAGRGQPAAVRGAARRDRRHHARRTARRRTRRSPGRCRASPATRRRRWPIAAASTR